MKIVIFSSYGNGFGDLSFGRKIRELIHDIYPDAEVVLLTDPANSNRGNKARREGFEQFNSELINPIQPLNLYHQKLESIDRPDIVIAGPSLTFDPTRIVEIVSNKNTPIILMSEYDFDPGVMDMLSQSLTDLEYHNQIKIPTGLDGAGIFLDRELLNYDDTSEEHKTHLFTQLILTRNTLLKGRSEVDYLRNTDIAVNYSHDNAERFICVHMMQVANDKNIDVIILGESDKKDKSVLQRQAEAILACGFSQVIYEIVGSAPVVIASASHTGPVYRVIHTGRVSSTESLALRKLCGKFGGGTGDQSYSEAIAMSERVVYEKQSWKEKFLQAMRKIGDSIDSNKRLSRALYLLGSAQSHEEYMELVRLLNDQTVAMNLKRYQQKIIQKHNLNTNLPGRLDAIIDQLEVRADHPADFEYKYEDEDDGAYFLHASAAMGWNAMIRTFLEGLAVESRPDWSNLNIPDPDGWLPIHLAAMRGFAETVGLLIEKGASVNSPKHRILHWVTPLYLAVRNKHKSVVRVLLNQTEKASIDALMRSLIYAAMHGDKEMVALLITKGNVDHAYAFYAAALVGDIDLVRRLMREDYNFNSSVSGNYTADSLDRNSLNLAKKGETALHAAAAGGHLEIVRALVESGANIHAQSENHLTPLHMAAACGKTHVVNWLLENGADINFNASNPDTIKSYKNPAIRDALKKLQAQKPGLRITINNNLGSPLNCAVEFRQIDVIKELLKHKASLENVNIDRIEFFNTSSTPEHMQQDLNEWRPIINNHPQGGDLSNAMLRQLKGRLQSVNSIDTLNAISKVAYENPVFSYGTFPGRLFGPTPSQKEIAKVQAEMTAKIRQAPAKSRK